jgi:hypothetical protein
MGCGRTQLSGISVWKCGQMSGTDIFGTGRKGCYLWAYRLQVMSNSIGVVWVRGVLRRNFPPDARP